MANIDDPLGRRLPIDPDRPELAEPSAHDTSKATAGRRRRGEPAVLVAIAAGGALGAPARYGLAQVIHVAKDGFPWATFWTNISGSFALGLLLALIVERFPPTRYLRPFAATGFLGAYTTYSTFAVETDLLVKTGHPQVAAAYAAASLAAGFLAMWAGMWAARTIPSPQRGGTP